MKTKQAAINALNRSNPRYPLFPASGESIMSQYFVKTREGQYLLFADDQGSIVGRYSVGQPEYLRSHLCELKLREIEIDGVLVAVENVR